MREQRATCLTSDTKDFRSSVWRLLVHLFLSGGLTAVLSVFLLASKRLSLLVYLYMTGCYRSTDLRPD
ncbi:hypothetical protein EMCRGX_G032313 [Ephydatia muelleri]